MPFYFLVSILAVLCVLMSLYAATVFFEHAYVKYWVRKNCALNTSTDAVIILPGVDWRNPIAWIKPNHHLDEIKAVVGYAKKRNAPFSVHIGPSVKDVESLMADKAVKTVYFVGHGGTNFFRLGTDEILCYSEFSDSGKYRKDFIHQVHCGTPYGKSLIDYVVPESNKKMCFFYPSKINGHFIEAEFIRMTSSI